MHLIWNHNSRNEAFISSLKLGKVEERDKSSKAPAHLIYPQREAIFFPLNQSYRGVGIYRTANEARQTNGCVDD